MSLIISPKSRATRGRLIDIEGGSQLQPALLLTAQTRGKLRAKHLSRKLKIFPITDSREVTINAKRDMQILNKLEMKYVG